MGKFDVLDAIKEQMTEQKVYNWIKKSNPDTVDITVDHLKKLRCWNNYVTIVENCINTHEAPLGADILISSFSWETTKEGFEYWDRMHDSLFSRLTKYYPTKKEVPKRYTIDVKDLIVILRDVEAIQTSSERVLYVDKIEEIVSVDSNKIRLSLRGVHYSLVAHSEEELRKTFIYKDIIGAPI